jgi:hypothetical protein
VLSIASIGCAEANPVPAETSSGATGGGAAASSGDGGSDSASVATGTGAGSTGSGGDGAAGGGTTGSGGAGGGGGSALPESYTLHATASGESEDGTESVDCTMTIFFIDVVHDDAGGFSANKGGEVFRIIDPAGDGKYEFQALVGFPGHLEPTATGVDVVLNDTPDPEAPPFWEQIDVLHGEVVGERQYEGSWTCAPLMVDEPGFKDTTTTVTGTWTLGPP